MRLHDSRFKGVGSLRLLMIIFLAVWPWVFGGGFALSVMTTAGIYAIVALGLSVLLGQAGQISLGQAAFFGIGAFGAGILCKNLGLTPLVGLIGGAAVAGVVALIIGRPFLKLKGYYLALATLGLGEVFTVVARQHKLLFNGTIGIVSIPPFKIGGWTFASYRSQYYLVWAVALVVLLVLERALRSRGGRALKALSNSETASFTLGVRTARWKLWAFVLSASLAGFAGGFFAFTIGQVQYSSFTTGFSLVLLIMLLVGGDKYLWGAVIGAIIMSWLSYAFTSFSQYQTALYAVVLLLLILYLPGGLLGVNRRYVDAIRRTAKRGVFSALGRVPHLRLRMAGAELAVPAERAGMNAVSVETAIARWTGSAISDQSSPSSGSDPSGNGSAKQASARGIVTPALPSSSANDPPVLLELDEVTVRFGGVVAVDAVSLSIRKGSISALLGPNGAGKTTVFNVISGLRKASSGRVVFAGRQIEKMHPSEVARLGMARTFQNLNLFSNMTVLENVLIGRHRHETAGFGAAILGLHKKEEEESRRRSLDALAVVGLEHLADWPVTALPYGKQRLVEIARALATEPSLLLLDEPAAGMNATEKAELVERIAAVRNTGVTVLLVEHDLGLVMSISEHVSVLNFGRLIAQGTPDEVSQDPAVIEAYLGVKREETAGTSAAATPRSAPETKDVSTAEGGAVLEVRGLSTKYGSIGALRGVDVDVKEGEIVAVLGSNGAGKTTMLRTISGLLKPSAGSVTYEGRNITHLQAQQIANSGIGHVPEGRHVFTTLSVVDNLKLGACCAGDKQKIAEDLDRVFEIFPRLAERRRQAAGTLSGGEQQMLAIGRGLMGRPKVMLLDEPSMGLAPMLVEAIFEALVRLNASGLPMLVVEQNAKMMLSIADRAYVLQTGVIALSGSAADLACDERVKALYLGHWNPECEEAMVTA